MARDIHDIYDVIMKIIVLVYGPIFLRFIGIEEEIKKVLDVEFTTITGKKFHLDYLCLLEDDTLCNIEFQFPIAKPTDLSRFFKYNILAEARYQKTANTYIINFTEFKQNIKTIKIGKSKSFHPEQIYLGDIPYDEILKKINIKVKSNESLTNEEEIILMISILTPKCKSKFETLKQICEFLEKKELFDATKLEFIKAIISLEINDFLSEEEKHKINKEIKMSPQAEKIVLQAINEVNQKVLYETKMKSLEEGIELGKIEGRKEGKIEGRKEERIEIAKNLKETMTPEEISKYTGLTTKEIERL